jgi:hypothetical protein
MKIQNMYIFKYSKNVRYKTLIYREIITKKIPVLYRFVLFTNFPARVCVCFFIKTTPYR